ncbi:MAG: hypothetical protein JSR77_16125 [Planctomycetes bacterium]|nr:hypothetical protein [Planctomycetota bacterium]
MKCPTATSNVPSPSLSTALRDMPERAFRGIRLGMLLASAALVAPATAQITIPIANPANLGTDGAFSPTQNTTVFLQAAVTGTWDQPGTGVGVYDASKWAVVYKFSSVNIPAGVTVTFSNHPSGAPVVWLVNGNVTINGTVNLNAAVAIDRSIPANPGPGGFRGGTAQPRTGGHGPGGGKYVGTSQYGQGGGFGTAGLGLAGGDNVYGTADLVPLIGGSGGAGGSDIGYGRGGAGGGAILIVSTGTITLNGTLTANGSQSNANDGGGGVGGGGSGGGVRLVCDTLVGATNATLSALAGPPQDTPSSWTVGGLGRIRTEANVDNLPITGTPARSQAPVGPVARLWPTTAEPKVTAVTLHSEPVPTDPRASIVFAATDVEVLGSPSLPVLTITCENVPVNATLTVRAVPATFTRDVVTATATFQSGDQTSSVWTAAVPLWLTGTPGGIQTPIPGAYNFTVRVTLP